ncbi:MAG TPA: MFS transporter [Burkholderiales bacterium]
MAARFFPGWIVVGAAFLAMFVAFGAMYGFAAFFRELEREFAASRADVSLVFSLSGFLYFAIGALTGSLADRYGPRLVVGAGMALIAAGMFLASRADTLQAVYLTYGIGVGLGVGFVYVPAIGTVQRWFERRRGLASGIAVAGIGVGTLVVPPLAGWLIGLAGWRNAYVILAVASLLLGLVAAALLDHSPERRGLHRDGIPPADSAAAPAAFGLSVAEALRSRPFWLLYAAGAATSFGIFIPFVHLAPYAVDRGLSEAFGVVLVGLIGVGSVVGRFALGGTADRIGRRFATGLMFAGMACMLFLWLLATGPVLLVVFALLFGTFYGGFVALIPALTADYFGGRSVAGIIGFLYTSVAFGTLFGPTLAGLAFDVTGSYTAPIVGGAVANLAAVLCLRAIADPARFRALVAARA